MGATERANLALLAPILGLSLLQFGLLPLLAGHDPVAEIVLLAAVLAATPLHWGLAHESFHGGFARDAGRNRLAGRVLAWFLFMSWDLIRFGHLMHHDANRHPFDRPEVVPEGGSRLGAVPAYFGKLLGGHAAISCVSALGVLAPERLTRRLIERAGGDPELAKIRAAALRAFTAPERRRRIRGDLAVMALLLVLALWAWGSAWPVFAASIAIRYLGLSLLDNAPHYGTAIDSGRAARNTTIPSAFRILVMNQNLHGVHHALPELDWRELPQGFRQLDQRHDGSWFVQVLRQFRGPLRPSELREIVP